MVTSVDGVVAVVTGAASGIGAALARRIAAGGARGVVVADLDEAGAQAVAAGLGCPAPLAVRLDVTDEAQVAAMADRVEAEVGPIDVWCSNAGLATAPGLGSDADWQRSWQLHALAHLYAARHVLPRMLSRDHGHLMITASAAGLLTEADIAAYAVTKHASVALAEWLAVQHGGAGVGFSCLCPQAVRTPMLASAPPQATTLAAGMPLEPEQVAEAVIDAWAHGRFLILPHPEVAGFEQRRAADRDRWLAGMRRLRVAARSRGAASPDPAG
jgi:NAD(P)-dependent dehydrogenase (short-subunit alcohol dehydrogenase family)